MKKPFITFTSDFGIQSQGVAIMEATALQINPEAHVLHLMHGLPDFNLFYAARTLETLSYMPVGYHVCVVDPGVGTERKPIIIETGRGDFLLGPDNGVLIPATKFLKGIKKVVEIANKKYMSKKVSPVFHGRDIFAPAAAHLSKGIKIEDFGKKLSPESLAKPPYEEAMVEGNKISAKIISINKFGSLHINITHSELDKLKLKKGDAVGIKFNGKNLKVSYATTFGDVNKNSPVLIKDDYGRVEIALNQNSFSKKYNVKIGGDILIKLEK